MYTVTYIPPHLHPHLQPTDLFAVDKEFMLGPSMLVRPILEPASGSSSTVDTALPQGARWFCAHTGAEIPRAQGLHQKLAVREGGWGALDILCCTRSWRRGRRVLDGCALWVHQSFVLGCSACTRSWR